MRISPPNRIRLGAAIALPILVGAWLWSSRHHPAVLAASWGLTMVASFVGWGSLARLWLAPGRRVDVGLRAGWGMALYLLLGGFLCFVRAAVGPVLVAQVMFGVGALACGAASIRLPTRAHLRRRLLLPVAHPGAYVLLGGTVAMTGLVYLAFLGAHWFNPSDDLPFYFTLVRKLERTSSLYEPFAARRVATFGAHVYLHSTFISVASPYYLNVVDAGITFVVVVALLLGHVTGGSRLSGRHALGLGLTALLLFSLQDVRVNTNSETSGLAAILALYRSVRAPLSTDGRPPSPFEPRRAVLLACLTLTCILLRISNAPAVLAFVGILCICEHFVTNEKPWSWGALRPTSRAVGTFVATFFGAFLPWSLMQKASSGTFFYPLGHSNVTKGWTLLMAPKGWAEDLNQIIGHLFYGKPVALLVLFAVAGLLPLRGRARSDLVALSVGTLLGLAFFSHQALAFGPQNTSRYLYATVAAMALVVVASAERRAPSVALVAIALATHVAVTRDDVKSTLSTYVQQAHAVIAGDGVSEVGAFDDADAPYRDLQDHVPAGATIATAVNESFRLDFKRNRIFALDVLGGMGPSPGWPAHKGPDVLAKYLIDCGVQYLAWVDFNGGHEFYGKAHWTPFLGLNDSYLQGQADLQLDAEDAIEKVSSTHRIAFRGGGMTLVDLGAPSR